MAPYDPCYGCRFAGHCADEAEINQTALWGWLEERYVSCADKEMRLFRGIEGVYDVVHG